MHPVASEGVAAISTRLVILAVYHDYIRKEPSDTSGSLRYYISCSTVLCTLLAKRRSIFLARPFFHWDRRMVYFLSRRCTARAFHDCVQFRACFCRKTTPVLENRSISIGKIVECTMRRKKLLLNIFLFISVCLYMQMLRCNDFKAI